MKTSRSARLTSTFSFTAVLLIAEMTSRFLSPSLPIDPGKWPRVEMAQKLDQMRSQANEKEEVDVLFVGSSMMAGGIDPLSFTEASGLSSYNAAFAGPSMRTITPWTLDIVVPLLKPKVVVLGLQTRELSDNGPKNEVMYEKFIASPGYREAASNIALRLGGKLESLSGFLKNRRILREPSQLFPADSKTALAEAAVRHEIGPQGRRNDPPGEYHSTEKFTRDLYEKTLADFAIGGPELEALRDLEVGLSLQGIRLLIMNMPVTEDYWTAHEDPIGDRLEYRAALERFTADTDVQIIEAESAFEDVQEFRDPMHLDVGARGTLAHALAEAWDEIIAGEEDHFEVVCNGSDACDVRPDEWLARR